MPAFTEALRPALKSERLLTAVEDHGPGPRPTVLTPWSMQTQGDQGLPLPVPQAPLGPLGAEGSR